MLKPNVGEYWVWKKNGEGPWQYDTHRYGCYIIGILDDSYVLSHTTRHRKLVSPLSRASVIERVAMENLITLYTLCVESL